MDAVPSDPVLDAAVKALALISPAAASEDSERFRALAAAEAPRALALMQSVEKSVRSAEHLVNAMLNSDSLQLSSSAEASAGVSGEGASAAASGFRGVSLLDVKGQMLMHYLVNLVCLIMIRISGTGDVNSSSSAAFHVLRSLIASRVYLEKLRPLEKKIKYAIDKLTNEAIEQMRSKHLQHTNGRDESGAASSEAGGGGGERQRVSALAFRANPDALLAKLDDDLIADGVEESSSAALAAAGEGEEGAASSSGVYSAPRISAALNDTTSAADKERRRQERARERLRKNELLSSMRASLYGADERPEEVRYGAAAELDEQTRVREQYEEENMLRLIVTKAEKKRQRQEEKKRMQTLNTDELESFSELYRAIGDGSKRGAASSSSAASASAADAGGEESLAQWKVQKKHRAAASAGSRDDDRMDFGDDDEGWHGAARGGGRSGRAHDASGDNEWMRAAISDGPFVKKRRGGGGGGGGGNRKQRR
jgi:hypothetical protein